MSWTRQDVTFFVKKQSFTDLALQERPAGMAVSGDRAEGGADSLLPSQQGEHQHGDCCRATRQLHCQSGIVFYYKCKSHLFQSHSTGNSHQF